MSDKLASIPVLIPAYNPDYRLVELVETLIEKGINRIVVVDDGSHSESLTFFEKVESLKPCTLLRHAVNCGKGRALKTGMNHIYIHFPEAPGVVTADCDGQHETEDILKVASALVETPEQFIIGARELKKDVPFRSKFGNVCTRFVFSFMVGKKIHDTQSGLRGLPLAMIPKLLNLKGERYEFEINMLILTKRERISIREIPIDTIYIEENRSSHFNPFFDSMKIYFQLLRYAFSSLFASIVDFILFTILFGLTGNILVSLLIGRFIVGSALNYIINRRLVFHSNAKVLWSLVKYYLAVGIMGIVSWMLINLAIQHLGLKVLIAKIVVESTLFVVSFTIQREFVFTNKAGEA